MRWLYAHVLLLIGCASRMKFDGSVGLLPRVGDTISSVSGSRRVLYAGKDYIILKP